MTLGEKAKGFSQLDYYFTNALNVDITIKVSFKNVNGKVEFSVNDGLAYGMNYNWSSAENPSAQLVVNFEKATVSFITRTVSFDTDCYGNDYVSNGKYGIDISMVMSGVTEESGFVINSICTQSFKSAVMKDIISPIIIVETKKGTFEKGTSVTLAPATVADILDPYTESSMYVKAPSGNYVKTVDGITLKQGTSSDRSYEIKLTENGSYEVVYQAKDGTGNLTDYTYYINVLDMTSPKLNVNTDTIYAKVGDNVTVKKYTASDETSKKVTVLVTLTDVYASVQEIETNSKIVFDRAGVYTVTYYAYDEADNFTIASYKIVVTEN